VLAFHLPTTVDKEPDYLDHIVAVPRRRNKAVLLLHVKNLKTVNMTYGFEYGDALLKQVADKIRQELKTDDNFFRFDGNRFVVVSDSVGNQEELRKLAKRLICIFDEPIADGTNHQYVDIQIAIVEIQARHTSTDKILQDALLTFLHIEENAAHPIVFFDERMKKSLQREDKIMKVLRYVIGGKDETSFYLEYQPKLDLNKNRIIGFEALARLRIDQLGQIPPDEFIALAEKKLLINELGNHILRLAADFIGRMQGQGIEDITVAVNISGIKLLREGFVEYLQRAPYLSERILQAMEFELTESVLLEDQ
jgi:diguanylate cyclase (GGDEF)-like protein